MLSKDICKKCWGKSVKTNKERIHHRTIDSCDYDQWFEAVWLRKTHCYYAWKASNTKNLSDECPYHLEHILEMQC